MTSSKAVSVALEKRTVVGKGLNGLRRSGKVPAVIHNHGQDSILVEAEAKKMDKVFAEAGKHTPVELTVGSEQHLALIKDVDFEPVKQQMRHIVFQAINKNEAVEAEVPLVFKEDTEIPAEKLSLLVLRQLDHVAVKALPRDLPERLEVDPSTLTNEGDNLTVADIIVPEGVTILNEPEQQIAIVEVPKDQVAEADAAAADLAADAATKSGGEDEAEAAPAADDAAEATGEATPTDEKA